MKQLKNIFLFITFILVISSIFVSAWWIPTPPPHGIIPIEDEEESDNSLEGLINNNAILYYTLDQPTLPLVDLVETLDLINGTFTHDNFAIINNSVFFNEFAEEFIYSEISGETEASNPLISFWFSFDNYETVVISNWEETLGGEMGGFYISSTAAEKLYIISGDNTGDAYEAISNDTLANGDYSHVCTYFDGDWHIYINGVEGTTILDDGATTINYTGVDYFVLGEGYSTSSGGFMGAMVEGFMDEVYYGNISSNNASDTCIYLYNAGLNETRYPFPIPPPTESTSNGWWPILGPYLFNNSNQLDFNESLLNNTIDARDDVGGGGSQWPINGPYLYNNSNILDYNESYLNETIIWITDDRDSTGTDDQTCAEVPGCIENAVTNITMNKSTYCGNINGATSNLCILVDTDTTNTTRADLMWANITQYQTDTDTWNTTLEMQTACILLNSSWNYTVDTDTTNTTRADLMWDNTSFWNVAYNWGDHSLMSYLTSIPSVNMTTNFVGEVTGTYDAMIVGDDVLDDQYYDSESDLTTLLDNNYADISVIDTNETTRFNTLTGTNCGAGDFMNGVDNDGTPACDTPAAGGSTNIIYMTCGENAALDTGSAEWSCGGNGETDQAVYIYDNVTLTHMSLDCNTGTGTANVTIQVPQGTNSECWIESTGVNDVSTCNLNVSAGTWIRPLTVLDSGHSQCVVGWRMVTR